VALVFDGETEWPDGEQDPGRTDKRVSSPPIAREYADACLRLGGTTDLPLDASIWGYYPVSVIHLNGLYSN